MTVSLVELLTRAALAVLGAALLVGVAHMYATLRGVERRLTLLEDERYLDRIDRVNNAIDDHIDNVDNVREED